MNKTGEAEGKLQCGFFFFFSFFFLKAELCIYGWKYINFPKCLNINQEQEKEDMKELTGTVQGGKTTADFAVAMLSCYHHEKEQFCH